MKLSIIKEGGIVVKDGVAYMKLDLSELPSDFHALQWDGTKGDLESKDADGKPVNTEIVDLTPYLWCVDAWQVAVQAQQDAELKAQQDAELYAQVTAKGATL